MNQGPSLELASFLDQSLENNQYLKALQRGILDYQLKPFNIMKLTPPSILQIYTLINSKFYQNESCQQIDCWYENQLRIFIWVLVVYAYLQDKHINQMNESDWAFFSRIFKDKNLDALQFQSLCLVKKRKTVKWAEEEIDLLTQIINEKQEKNRWNQIAKKIFISSDKKYFRTPKQCREQWINHLDPTKIRSKWTTMQDYEMIKGIIEHGKKWSRVAKHLGGNRTEHMVKNRYKSMIRNEIKRLDYEENEQILIAKIKQRLESSLLIKKYNKANQKQKNENNTKNWRKSSKKKKGASPMKAQQVVSQPELQLADKKQQALQIVPESCKEGNLMELPEQCINLNQQLSHEEDIYNCCDEREGNDKEDDGGWVWDKDPQVKQFDLKQVQIPQLQAQNIRNNNQIDFFFYESAYPGF